MEIQPIESANPPHINPPQRTQAGYKSTHVAHAERIVINNNNTCPFLSNPLSFLWNRVHKPVSGLVEVDDEYYNLIVVQRNIRHNRLTIHKDRVLKGETKIVRQLSILDDAAIEKIKAFPSLIMYENKDYSGLTTPDQEAHFGFITGIREQEDNCIRIYFHSVATINQQAINDLAVILDIRFKNGVMELNETHWTVKNVNLIEELTEADLLPGWPETGREAQ